MTDARSRITCISFPMNCPKSSATTSPTILVASGRSCSSDGQRLDVYMDVRQRQFAKSRLSSLLHLHPYHHLQRSSRLHVGIAWAREASFRLTPCAVPKIQTALRVRLHEQELIRCDWLTVAFSQAKIRQPRSISSNNIQVPKVATIDQELCSSLSQLVTNSRLSLEATVSLWRNESPRDPRPNKALDPAWLDILLHGYEQRHVVVNTAKRGVTHRFTGPRPPDPLPVRNHNSARAHDKALEHSLADGQASGTYLVLDLRVALRWKQIRFSPFGCIPKKSVDPHLEGRLIHDLSYPGDTSINARSTQDEFPALEYESIRRLACRIESLARQHPLCVIKILKGDVKSAFRLIPVSSRLAAHFAGARRDLAIIDMALPFGWTGSPAHYGAFGGAISVLVSRESPRSMDPTEIDDECFLSFVWVDDHILLEVDRDNRLPLAETALRLSMLASLGPLAINEKKFSKWCTCLDALGLTWDTQYRTVSLPPEKLSKARSRIAEALQATFVSRHQIEQLVGSLRYMSMCCRSTRAFIQRLHTVWRRSPRFQKVRLPPEVTQDLLWIDMLLQNGASTSVPTSIVTDTLAPDVNLFMDACDDGLAVLYPAAREYIRVQFDNEERRLIRDSKTSIQAQFSINVREALSAVFAVVTWGRQWQLASRGGREPVHIRCWIDNTSAVAWIGDHSTRNTVAQELTRVHSCSEMVSKLHITTRHLRGSSNALADLGSRPWTGSALKQWTNRVRLWSQQEIPTEYRKIYKPKSTSCSGNLSPTRPGSATSTCGDNGVSFAPDMASTGGCSRTTPNSNPYNSFCSRLRVGSRATDRRIELIPYGLRSAMSDGVIASEPAFVQCSNPNMSSYCKECGGLANHGNNEQRYRSTCSSNSSGQPTCPSPSTASFVGLRCWASSFA